MIFIKFALASC